MSKKVEDTNAKAVIKRTVAISAPVRRTVIPLYVQSWHTRQVWSTDADSENVNKRSLNNHYNAYHYIVRKVWVPVSTIPKTMPTFIRKPAPAPACPNVSVNNASNAKNDVVNNATLEINTNRNEIYVGGLHHSINEADLLKMFLPFGNITKISVVKRFHNQHAGYGFVAYDKPLSAANAIAGMNKNVERGRKLFVHQSFSETERKIYKEAKFQERNKQFIEFIKKDQEILPEDFEFSYPLEYIETKVTKYYKNKYVRNYWLKKPIKDMVKVLIEEEEYLDAVVHYFLQACTVEEIFKYIRNPKLIKLMVRDAKLHAMNDPAFAGLGTSHKNGRKRKVTFKV